MCAPGPSCSRTHTRAPAGAMLWLLLSLLRSGPARAVVGPLRVRYDFSDPSLYLMDDAARDLYQNSILPEAAEYIGRALSVERVEGPLRLARECLIRENDDHCYLLMDNASKLQKATYLRLWRARFWLRSSQWRKIHRQFRMEVPPVNKMLNRLDGLLVRLVNRSSVGPIEATCGSRFQECVQNVPCEEFHSTQEMCGRSAIISDKLLDDGPGLNDTDLVVFVTYDDSICSNTTIASAFTCKHDQASGRPIAGALNICVIQSYTDALVSIIHELGHLVGITSRDYQWYREAGAPRPPRPVDYCWKSPRGMFAHYILPPFLLLPVVLYFVVWIPEFLTLASTSPGDVPDLIRRGLSELATL